MNTKTKRLTAFVAGLLLVGCLVSPGFSAVKFGVKAGLDLANWSSREFMFEGYPLKNKAGLVVGVFSNLGLAKNLSFHPEILYL